MSNLLTQKNKRKFIKLTNIISIKSIIHIPNESTKIIHSKGECNSTCISCENPRCVFYERNEIDMSSESMISNYTYDQTLKVCPCDAISFNEDNDVPQIDNSLCISCGLCSKRCPMGAIYFDDNEPKISVNNDIIEEKESTKGNVVLQNNFISSILKVKHKGQINELNEGNLNYVYNRINDSQLKQTFPNTICRNLIKELNNNVYMHRKGDVNFRIDGIIEGKNLEGIVEVEFGMDYMEAPRAILDDIAILFSRYDIPFNQMNSTVVFYEMPNSRSDYWRVVSDINNITHIRINTISLGILLLYLWSLQTLDLSSIYNYIDSENYNNCLSLEELNSISNNMFSITLPKK